MTGWRIIGLVVLVCGVAMTAQGQGAVSTPGTQSRGVRTDKVSRELQRQVEMQMIEQALTVDGSSRVRRYSPLVLEQIREDFLRIQVIDRKLMQANPAPDNLDLNLIGKSAGEIKTRSSRLKENLYLPRLQPTATEKSSVSSESTRERLQRSLSDLSQLIDRFVSNPMFEHSRLVDAELSGKARQDLEAIIELSKQIKRNSEKLKASEKVVP